LLQPVHERSHLLLLPPKTPDKPGTQAAIDRSRTLVVAVTTTTYEIAAGGRREAC